MLTAPRMHGIDVDVLDGSRRLMGALTAASLGLAQRDPIGGPIAGACKALVIHEGLQQIEGLTILGLPVGGDPAADPAQDVAGQVRHAQPRQDGHIRRKFCAWRGCSTPITPERAVKWGCWRGDDPPARCTCSCRMRQLRRCLNGCSTQRIAKPWSGERPPP